MTLWLKDDLASRKLVIYRAILFSIVTLFILFVFQPFGTTNDTEPYKLLRLSGYGLVTFCALLLSGFIEIFLIRLNLSNKLQIIVTPSLYILITALFNHGYFVVAMLGAWHWQNQILFIVYTLAVGLFPISFIFVVNRHAKHMVLTTEKIPVVKTKQRACEEVEKNNVPPHRLITLIGDNKGDKLTIALSDILFIKSADNYCELVTIENDVVSHKLLRITLTGLLKQLPQNTFLYRCHRSYAVNLQLVAVSKGNAGGLQLSMNSFDFTIPVSRTYVDVIKQALLLTPDVCGWPQKHVVSN